MTYTWEQAKADAEISKGMESQMVNFGWQYVEHQAHRGLGLIELKENTPHGEFLANLQRAVNLKQAQAYNLMTLARNLPLLEANKPTSQRDALKLINARKEKPMPAWSWMNVAAEEGVISASANALIRREAKAEIMAVDPGALKSDTDARWRASCRVVIQNRADKNTDPNKRYEDHREEYKTLPATAKEKFDRLIARELKLRNEMIDVEVNKAADAKIPERIALYAEMTQKASDQVRNYSMRKNGIQQNLSVDDYRFLLNVLHPDRAPEDVTRERLEKAFDIVKKLEPYIKAFA